MTISCPDFSPPLARNALDNATRQLSCRGLYVAARWAAELHVSILSNINTPAAPNISSKSSTATYSTSTPNKPNRSRQSTAFSDMSFNQVHPSPAPSPFSRSIFIPPSPVPSFPSRDQLIPSSSSITSFTSATQPPIPEHEAALISLAKSYFDTGEFARVSYTLSSCKSAVAVFLHLYSKFLDAERNTAEDAGVIMGPKDKIRPDLQPYTELLSSFENTLDPFLLYLKGVILDKVGRRLEAIDSLVSSIKGFPYNWSCWLKITSLIESPEELNVLDDRLPDSFMFYIFSVHAALELHSADETLQQNINDLLQNFPNSIHLKSQQALIHYHLREFDDALSIFDEIYEADPYRVDDIDTYSNILYVMENRPKLYALADKYIKLDRNRPETCCLVGNYFSLKGEHEKAVSYFRRALKLDRGYLSAWTLMGHEYVELKNTHAAVEAYRRAVDVNKKDYRAWYGLGQTYELMEMFSFSLYYYQRATALRPYDTRMWAALGSCYERLKIMDSSIDCFERALECAKPMDLTLASRLASLHEQQGDIDKAAEYHTGVVNTGLEEKLPTEEYVSSCLWLARWEINRDGNLPSAERHLERCMAVSTEEKEEAKALLLQLRMGKPSKHR